VDSEWGLSQEKTYCSAIHLCLEPTKQTDFSINRTETFSAFIFRLCGYRCGLIERGHCHSGGQWRFQLFAHVAYLCPVVLHLTHCLDPWIAVEPTWPHDLQSLTEPVYGVWSCPHGLLDVPGFSLSQPGPRIMAGTSSWVLYGSLVRWLACLQNSWGLSCDSSIETHCKLHMLSFLLL
jgi:hypothetical protein